MDERLGKLGKVYKEQEQERERERESQETNPFSLSDLAVSLGPLFDQS